jgi:Flp pilus assembly protein TadD
VKRTTDTAKKEQLLRRTAKILVEEARAPGEALALLELACVEAPDSIEAALECARVLITLVRPEDGLALLEPILGRARHKSAALRAEILLEMGKAYLALGEQAEALERLRTAFALHTRNRELAMLLGVVAHDLGEDTTAERALEAAIDLTDDDDDVDVRVATRILEAIALMRDTISTAPSRRLSGIETRGSSPRTRASRG